MNRYETAVWQHYNIDPLDLIGRSARLTVVTDEGASSGAGHLGRWGNGHHYFGVVESIHEHRGKVYLDEPGGDWAVEALGVEFSDTYPFVLVTFRGGLSVKFDPEKDAASFEWVEVSR